MSVLTHQEGLGKTPVHSGIMFTWLTGIYFCVSHSCETLLLFKLKLLSVHPCISADVIYYLRLGG